MRDELIPCSKCRDVQILTKGNVFHEISSKSIFVLNVDHYWCEKCKNISYPSDLDIIAHVKYAYKNEFNVILFD